MVNLKGMHISAINLLFFLTIGCGVTTSLPDENRKNLKGESEQNSNAQVQLNGVLNDFLQLFALDESSTFDLTTMSVDQLNYVFVTNKKDIDAFFAERYAILESMTEGASKSGERELVKYNREIVQAILFGKDPPGKNVFASSISRSDPILALFLFFPVVDEYLRKNLHNTKHYENILDTVTKIGRESLTGSSALFDFLSSALADVLNFLLMRQPDFLHYVPPKLLAQRLPEMA